jgi:hypothetical protein
VHCAPEGLRFDQGRTCAPDADLDELAGTDSAHGAQVGTKALDPVVGDPYSHGMTCRPTTSRLANVPVHKRRAADRVRWALLQAGMPTTWAPTDLGRVHGPSIPSTHHLETDRV